MTGQDLDQLRTVESIARRDKRLDRGLCEMLQLLRGLPEADAA